MVFHQNTVLDKISRDTHEEQMKKSNQNRPVTSDRSEEDYFLQYIPMLMKKPMVQDTGKLLEGERRKDLGYRL
jgi:arsenate reductase-like glutaredoxin family protein